MAIESAVSTRRAVIYQLFLRAFTPEGTINAAAKLLPHLASIGVDIVYLCPITTSDDDMDRTHWSERQRESGIDNPCNPYRLKDYYEIDPEYGTDEDLLAFVRTAHQLGLRVILDLVYWHCGPKANIIAEHPDFVQRDQNGELIFNEYNFALLNYDNPALREYLYNNMVYFIDDFDVDGYRADVACAVPVDFWNEARRRLVARKPDLIMLAESEEPALHDQAFDLSYAFRWSYPVNSVFDGKAPATAVKACWQELNDLMAANPPRFVRCIDNHDIASDDLENRQEKRRPLEANDAALLLDFTIDGIPFVYNGQEIADATRLSLWSNRFHTHNQCIDWSKALTADGRARLEFFKKLTALRHETPALVTRKTQWVDNTAPEQVISFLRLPDSTDGKGILVVINASAKAAAGHIGLGLKRGDMLGVKMSRGASHRLDGARLHFDLLPYGFLVIEMP